MARKRIAHVCGDTWRARSTAFADQVVVHRVGFGSWLPEWGYDAVAYDLDQFDPEQRCRLIAELTSRTPRRPTAVHSRNLDDTQMRDLKARGILVGRRLDDSLIQALASLIPSKRRQAG